MPKWITWRRSLGFILAILIISVMTIDVIGFLSVVHRP